MAYTTTALVLGSFALEPLCRVTSSAQGIQAVASNIYSYTSYPDVVNALRKLDIEASIRILEKLIMVDFETLSLFSTIISFIVSERSKGTKIEEVSLEDWEDSNEHFSPVAKQADDPLDSGFDIPIL